MHTIVVMQMIDVREIILMKVSFETKENIVE